MQLTPGEHIALKNLARKAKGEEVDWINIAAARTLTDKGLCARDQQGWRISAQGVRLVGEQPFEPAAPQAPPTPIRS